MSSRTLEFLVSPTDENRTFSLSLPSAEELSISEEEERSTAAAFVGCVSEAAKSDRGRRISVDHARTLILRPQTGTPLFSGYTVTGRVMRNAPPFGLFHLYWYPRANAYVRFIYVSVFMEP